MASIWFWVAVWFASLFLILKSASYAVDSVTRFAGKAGFSHFFVGLLIVSLSTSLPELFTGIISSLENNPALVIGDLMGASILDVTLVLGAVAIISKKLEINKKKIRIVPWRIIGLVSLPLILGIDGTLSRLDGAIFVAAFLLYYIFDVISEIKHEKIAKDMPIHFVLKEVFIFGANIALLIFGAQLLVSSSTNIATYLGIPQYIFGAFILAICTTFPELVIEIKSSMSGKPALAFGDLFGSLICNMGLIMGISLLIRPLEINMFDYYSFGIFLFVLVLFSQFFIIRKEIRRNDGILLILLYIIFVATQVIIRMY